MYYDSDGKFYLEPEGHFQGQGYDTYFQPFDSIEAAFCLDPESGPFFLFNSNSEPDTATLLNHVVALVEAGRGFVRPQGQQVQVFYITLDGYMWVSHGEDFDRPYLLYPVQQIQPVKFEFCRN